MTWFVLSLLTALCESLKDVFSKKGLKITDEYVISWSLRFFALFFLLPILFFIDIPLLGEKFWIALLIGGVLNVVTTVLYMKAIKYSDLSITVPMVAFTPLFLLLTSPLIIGEFPSFWGLIGILLIVTGSYVLNIREKHSSYFAPFHVLLKEPGPKRMLAVAFIWSITSNFDKIGVQNSSPIFWSVAVNLFVAVFLLPVMFYKSPRENLRLMPKNLSALIPVALFGALTVIFQMTAISLTLVAYVISIKRMGAVMSVLFGHFLFKEKGLKERLVGASIMIIGVLLIGLL